MTYTEQITLTAISCGICGASYAINERFRRDCEEKGRSWHCPYCSTDWGYAEGENVRLKRELEQAQVQLRASKCETMAEHQHREKAEKKLRRVSNGVCPCCRRSFGNLARHMKTKHPEVVKSARSKPKRA